MPSSSGIFPAQGAGIRELERVVLAFRPEVAIWSSATPSLNSDLAFAASLKAMIPGIITGTFGTHAGTLIRECFEAFPKLDYIIRGEPELTVQDLIEALEGKKDPGQVPGLAFMRAGKDLVVTEARALPKNLDDLPDPAWHLLDLNSYRLPLKGPEVPDGGADARVPLRLLVLHHAFLLWEQPSPALSGARRPGNPPQCGVLRRAGFSLLVRHLHPGPPYVKDLCQAFLDAKLDVSWACNSRVDTADLETFRIMKRAGCWMVSYGIESSNQDVLNLSKKGAEVQDAGQAVRWTKEAGLMATGHFVLGLPGDTESSIQETIAIFHELGLDFAQYYCAVPFPGSSLYTEAKKNGWLPDTPWEDFRQDKALLRLPGLPPETVERLRDDAYKRFYSNPKTWLSKIQLIRPSAIPHLFSTLKAVLGWRHYPCPSSPLEHELILGLWDGHDSGAALVRGGDVLFAINEERLTRRKLEIRFPHQAIGACLSALKISPADVQSVVYSTTDFAKTLTRSFPSLKEEYYQIRRRKSAPSAWTAFKKMTKYKATEFLPSRWTRRVSDFVVRRELSRLGFRNVELHCVEHHAAHAAGAFFSGFDPATVLTLDGIGDGLSGSVYRFEQGKLDLLSTIPGADSLGIFYEHVTNLMNMRELEDEGKVMALANLAYPVPDDKNPMLAWVQVTGMSLRIPVSSLGLYRRLKEVLWKFPSEQFCYMAQRTLEVRVVELVKNILQATGARKLVFSGGVASNIKLNRLLRNLPEVEDMYVFPPMGDGGQALGAAVLVAAREKSRAEL